MAIMQCETGRNLAPREDVVVVVCCGGDGGGGGGGDKRKATIFSELWGDIGDNSTSTAKVTQNQHICHLARLGTY